jgi:hypothetical protein
VISFIVLFEHGIVAASKCGASAARGGKSSSLDARTLGTKVSKKIRLRQFTNAR